MGHASQQSNFAYRPVSDPTAPNPNAKPQSSRSGRRGPSVIEWTRELVGILGSILSLLAVIAIGLKMNGRPLSEWPIPIPISTVISGLAVVSRATTMIPVASCISQMKWLHFKTPHKVSDMEVYDTASRGGLGSLMLLLRMPTDLASIGALVTILVYVLGPSYQQVVQLERGT